jgi:hypothetical protein
LQRQTPGHDFFHVDHYRAIRDGGTNDESNLVPACAECNHARARLPLGEDQNPANWVGVGTEADTNAGVSVGLAADRKAQKLEARCQMLEAREEQAQAASPPCAPTMVDGHDPSDGSPKLPVPISRSPFAPADDAPPLTRAVEAYNFAARAAGWPQCSSLSPARRGALNARLRELGAGGADPLQGWQAVLDRARQSTFLTAGGPDQRRFFSFDWIVKPANFLKIREGNYDDAPQGARPVASPKRGTLALVAAGFAALGDADRDK